MIGDIKIPTQKEKLLAKEILPKILKLGDKKIITIQGGSGTKKSELMDCLQEELYKLRKRVLGISLDDYYHVNFRDRNRIRKRQGIKGVGKSEIDWGFLKGICKSFLNYDKEIKIQQVNKYTDSFIDSVVNEVDKLNFIILEGLYAGYLKNWDLVDLCIHLKGNPEQTLSFRKKRNKENENNKFRLEVVKKEYKVVNKLRKYADIVIPWK